MIINKSFSDATISAVWGKGLVVPGYNPDFVRKDYMNTFMERKHYGNRDVKTGWEIDHIVPVSSGGSDMLNNLQPLQWENNAKKSDNNALSFLFRRS